MPPHSVTWAGPLTTTQPIILYIVLPSASLNEFPVNDYDTITGSPNTVMVLQTNTKKMTVKVFINNNIKMCQFKRIP